jgi:2-C-methyl-D-erythritol 4-phosphate cytidylyltransferase/2-C-methyl-D-erythritol 2,4-cyclodiphosphate synthase
MSLGVIIVAGGRGDRMGSSVPKQLLEIGGRTLLRRSIAGFDALPFIDRLVVVLPAELVARGPELAGVTRHECRFAGGGERRQDSVACGFHALGEDMDEILVHDAARPFVDPALVIRVVDGLRRTGAALPVLFARDTVKRVDRASGLVAATIARDEIGLAQTPQGFRRAVLADALAHGARGATATDEAMLAELAGHPVAVVEGDERNVKITTAEDLALARARAAGAPRVGTGYDLHRLVDGRPLVLAGEIVPCDRGPAGHSDGDVVCHALIDAMLGAAAAGDIGQHFPNNDVRWQDAPGLDLLQRTVEITRSRGWATASADVTVVLERPKLAPHIPAIRAALARVLGIDESQVSVKAKTNEGVDAVGRGDAMAAHAVAVLVAGGR